MPKGTPIIDYDHALNRHTAEGAAVGFRVVRDHLPAGATSIVDVGCGTGVWLRAAQDEGFRDVAGIDGVIPADDRLVVPRAFVQQKDLTSPLDMGRRFDVALCLEVAEHLEEPWAPVLVASLISLADTVVFSAACPGQTGQHHVNCQWPAYWQGLFNTHGYVCDDAVRWSLWDLPAVEPWYRQNMFIARRDPPAAGHERRIPAVVHPGLSKPPAEVMRDMERRITGGSMPVAWYLWLPVAACMAKVSRRLKRGRSHE